MNEINEKDEKAAVPFYVFESFRIHNKNIITTLIVALIITIVLLFATNIAWLTYESQFDYADEEVTLGAQDNGNANYIGQDGDISNGIHQSQNENEN